jgi:hypothetical protein
MKNICYKFWYITRDDDGFITEAGIRFYEGQKKNIQIGNLETKERQTVNMFVREKRLTPVELTALSSKATRKELNGDDAIVYTPAHFGQIKSDDELRLFLNKELAKDKAHTPEEAQAEVNDIKKVK